MQALVERGDEIALGGVTRVAALGKREPEGEHALRTEARIDAKQALEAAQQQPRADEQRYGERHLRDDNRAARTCGGVPRARPARPRTQGAGDVRVEMHRRQ